MTAMYKDPNTPRGTVETLEVPAPALAGNRLGLPARVTVAVWRPAGADGAGLPLLVDLAAYTSSGLAHAGWKGFGETLVERLDRLSAQGALPPVVVAMPDGFNRLGGNQYVASPVFGDWPRFLARDLIGALEARYGCGGDGRRGLFGHSSGGYGALVNALSAPEVWAACACHSGDMGFEWCYGRDLPATVMSLAQEGGITPFLDRMAAAAKPRGRDIPTLMTLAMAASYDPAPDPAGPEPLGLRLPVTLDTAEWIPDRWGAWLAHDPVRMPDGRLARLGALKRLWIDCGDRDEYFLHFGARILARRLRALGVDHSHQEFPDGHSGVDYRLDFSLPALATALG